MRHDARREARLRAIYCMQLIMEVRYLPAILRFLSMPLRIAKQGFYDGPRYFGGRWIYLEMSPLERAKDKSTHDDLVVEQDHILTRLTATRPIDCLSEKSLYCLAVGSSHLDSDNVPSREPVYLDRNLQWGYRHNRTFIHALVVYTTAGESAIPTAHHPICGRCCFTTDETDS